MSRVYSGSLEVACVTAGITPFIARIESLMLLEGGMQFVLVGSDEKERGDYFVKGNAKASSEVANSYHASATAVYTNFVGDDVDGDFEFQCEELKRNEDTVCYLSCRWTDWTGEWSLHGLLEVKAPSSWF